MISAENCPRNPRLSPQFYTAQYGKLLHGRKRAKVSGTKARMKTEKGRKIIAKRRAKGRWMVNPGRPWGCR